MNRTVVVMAKNPQLGKVKTRLAEEVGDQEALDIYMKLLLHTKDVLEDVPAQRFIYFTNFVPASDELWGTDLFDCRLQTTGDLGRRMLHAFKSEWEPGMSILIIGSDCPQLTPAIMEQAFKALEALDVVIGPALDGGYYLIGSKVPYDFLFEQMPWSTSSVFQETINRVKENGKSYAVLPELSDVDYLADWRKFGLE